MSNHPRIAPYVQCRCPHCAFGPLRMLHSGSFWPKGRVQARNEAQAREFERALKAKPNAATVAA